MSAQIAERSLLFARSVPGGKVREELVDLSEAGVAVKGVDVIGREGDGSGIGSWKRHIDEIGRAHV